MEIENFDIFEATSGPKSLFEYVQRYVLSFFDGFELSPLAKTTMSGTYFSYSIYKQINDFMLEDWRLSAVLLNSWDYSLAYVILSQLSGDDNKEYRLGINVETPTMTLDIISTNGYGDLFTKSLNEPHQLQAVGARYHELLRSRDKNLKPIRRLEVERSLDSEQETIYVVKEKNVFFSTIGPYSLFKHSKTEASKHIVNLENLDQSLVKNFINQYPELIQHFTPLIGNKWIIEAAVVDESLALSHVLFFHHDNTQLHLLVDGAFRVQELFCEKIIYENLLDPTRQEFFEKTKAFYEPIPNIIISPLANDISPTNPQTEKEVVVELEAVIESKEKVEDPYSDFRANFAGKSILVVGPSHLSEAMMNDMAKDLFLPSGVIDYKYPDYTKLTGKSFDYLRGQQQKYLGIILGPYPHKIHQLGKYPSLSSKLKLDPGFPFCIEAVSNTTGKILKITKSGFSHALFEIMRNALAFG